MPRMADPAEPDERPSRLRAGALAALYAVLGVADYVSAQKKFRLGEWAAKPLLMPALTAFTLAASGKRKDTRLPAAGMILGGLGDTALLASEIAPEAASERWFIPGMGAFAAGHACSIAALVRDGAHRGVRPGVAAVYAALWAGLIAVLWRRLGNLRVPVAGYSLLLVTMAVLASGRNREAAAGGALFVLSDAIIALGLAEIKAVPRQESAVMPTYLAAQALLAAGWLRPQREIPEKP
jgi:uncharacterized membrane protein YhhN